MCRPCPEEVRSYVRRPSLQPCSSVYYEQGPQQEIQAVWLEATPTQPAASPTPTSVGESLHGKVETIGVSTLTLQTSDGKTVTVDTSAFDRQSVASVRPAAR